MKFLCGIYFLVSLVECHPEFISGSDIQCGGILKQVQDDYIYNF